jgi:plastocyanin
VLAPTAVAERSPAASLQGAIEGRIHLTSAVRGRPMSSAAYSSRVVRRVPATDTSSSTDVVIYLKDAPAAAELPLMHAEIRQQNEQFLPHVLPITVGSTVEFPNFDPFFHNVFSLSGGAKFDLGRYPQGESRLRRFTKPGLVKVYCHIHSHMSAVILVFDHPYFARVGDDGRFSLTGVPAGHYTLTAWHERIGQSDLRVSVEAGRLATAAFTLPVLEP